MTRFAFFFAFAFCFGAAAGFAAGATAGCCTAAAAVAGPAWEGSVAGAVADAGWDASGEIATGWAACSVGAGSAADGHTDRGRRPVVGDQSRTRRYAAVEAGGLVR